MSDGILTITGFGRFEKLHAEYNKLLQQNMKLANELKKVQQQSKRTDDAQGAALSSLASKTTQLVAGYLSLQAAIAAVNSAIQKQIELGEKAAGSSSSLAAAQADFSSALGVTPSTAFRRSTIGDVQRFGTQFGVREDVSLRVMAQILNAVTDAKNERQRMQIGKDIFRSVVPFFPNVNQEAMEAGATAAAVGHVRKGIPNVPVEDVSRLMFGMLGSSALSGPDKLPNAAMAVIAAQTNRKGVKDQLANTIQAMSIFAGIGNRLGDSDGELARTASSGLFTEFSRIAGPFGADLPIGDAIKKAARERPDIINKTLSELIGRTFTKAPQAEVLQGDITGALADIAAGEMDSTPDQWREAARFAVEGTPEIKRGTQMRIAGAVQDRENRRLRATVGTVRAMLFGGQVGEESFVGDLPSTSGGWMDSLADMGRRGIFEAAIAAGVDPKMAAMGVLGGAIGDARSDIGSFLGGRGESQIKLLEEAVKRIGSLPDAIERSANATTNGQNAQAAAAQRGAHTE